ncbi:rab GTPase-activating protein 1-like isoform X2 [Mya arenaria]|uniref:rab GTPase-activating protein 1-like isoform X2 n=1 Tax=Mya arenaria TaxID=6604 RepID=UPI0022E1BE48|nr:rab GTPase-activating protein 1-like isoform X2 [Mya arenaria]
MSLDLFIEYSLQYVVNSGFTLVMEDAVSRSSLDSSSTGDEYVLVNADPKLRITGDINDLNTEISEPDSGGATGRGDKMENSMEREIGHVIPSSQSVDILNTNGSANTGSDDVTVTASSVSLPTTPTGDCIVFHGVTYLGCAVVNAPRSEVEIYRNMAILNEQSHGAMPIVLSVPANADGVVRLLEPDSDTEISSYKIHRILFCARGPADSNEKRCFAFTFSHGVSAESAIFQCHVFRCDLPEAVAKILYCFASTFRRVPKNRSTVTKQISTSDEDFVFTVNLEFREEDGKGGFTLCPRDKNVFKLRCNLDKRLTLTVQQTGTKQLRIERCFGLLISPGRNVKHGDMTLIEKTSMGYTEDTIYVITGNWDPTEASFAVLNTETPRDTRVFMTAAIDLVIVGIQEPVRFAIETKAKIFPQTEKFWYFMSKPHTELFHLKLKPVEGHNGEISHEVLGVRSQSDLDRRKAGMTLPLGHAKFPTTDIQTPIEGPEELSDGDEPLLSGSGVVSKEITDENLLEAWREVLKKWQQNLTQKPKQVSQLAKKGIPEALRGEVWQLLAGAQNNSELLEAYRILITKESSGEGVIQRDINRTFPAHDFFKESGGLGQESLFKIAKAYSVYDEEIGYCQGQSFLIAALLLHMPEEQAFCVLVKIMFDYGLRDFFRNDFGVLHLAFYQLERLLQDQLPDVFDHFMEMGLEAHMYASQWFLTLFTAKFPLFMVFHILDIFLSEGRNFAYHVALGLLKVSRKDLLALDFEGVLKYFRVQLPKRFRTEEATSELMQVALNCKIRGSKLKKYEKEYQAMKEQEMQQEDPLVRFERENKRLMDANIRLEQENDDMAHELVESKLNLSKKLDASQDLSESLTMELMTTKKKLLETEEEKQRLETESSQVKEMCRRELERLEADNTRNTAIIADYKQICSQLSERLEKQQTANKNELESIRSQVKSCETCSKLFDQDGKVQLPEPKIDPDSVNPKVLNLESRVRELELELAQTKLALVEAECKSQDLTHQLTSAVTEIQASKNTWFSKFQNSIKDVSIMQKKDPSTKDLQRKDSTSKE